MDRPQAVVGPSGPMLPEPLAMVAASVASLIRDRVQFELECIDRMYLNLYLPGLQTPEGLVSFLRQEPGVKVYSTSAIAPMTRAFMSSMERYVTRHRPAMLAPSRAAPRHPPLDTAPARLEDFAHAPRHTQLRPAPRW